MRQSSRFCFSPQVYAVGGYDGQSRLSSVECYDSFSNRWTEVAPMKEAVSSPAVASCAGKLYVIGGGPDDNTCSDKVGNVWTPPPTLTKTVMMAELPFVLDNLFYIII